MEIAIQLFNPMPLNDFGVFFAPLFAQAVTDTAAAVIEAGATAQTVEEISIFSLILRGGWVMAPIFLLLAIALYLTFYKYMIIKRYGKVDHNLLRLVVENLNQGDIRGASNLCRNNPSLLARLLDRGIMRLGSPMQEIESGMESAARGATSFLDKHLSILASIATLAPMFGFLGTVIGMIAVFSDIANSDDNLSISTIANGMYVKMITSAAGLMVGIFAHAVNIYLNSMVDATLHNLENASHEFLDVLYKPKA